MSLFELCQWLNDSSIGTAIRESTLMFPIIETIHVLAITLMAGTVAVVDLRLLGLVFKREPVTKVMGDVMPLTWTGFAVMFVTGGLLFWAGAAKLYSNPAFRLKLILLLIAGVNPLVFHLTVFRSVDKWEMVAVAPIRARTAAVLSLVLWSGIIITGRAIAYL